MKVILVLPDRDGETVAIGRRLRPQMVGYNDGDYLDVAAVLTRMSEKRKPKESCKDVLAPIMQNRNV
jgi:hypothetical protein